MSKDTTTKHLVFDLKTGFAYGLKLDGLGNFVSAQALNMLVETMDGRPVSHFGPLESAPEPLDPALAANPLPYGKTTHMVEFAAGDAAKGRVFTVVWPSLDDTRTGARPAVAQKEMPGDLSKTGFVPAPKGGAQKGAGIENEQELKNSLSSIDRMIGLDKAKKEIVQNIALTRFNKMKEDLKIPTKSISRHMVFTGNPGTGKTTFAREVAKAYYALGIIDRPEVHEVKREDLVAGFIGQTEIKTKEAIEKARGGILFIDEAYALSRGESDGKDFGRVAIDVLVAAMENMREDLIVVVAGYPDPMKRFIDANEGLKSRFMTYIQFDNYGTRDLEKIMDLMLEDRGYVMEPDARRHALALLEDEGARAGKDFGNGRTVRNLVEMAEKHMAERLNGEGKLARKSTLSRDVLKTALTTVTLQDVMNVNLQGLSPEKKAGIGFGFDLAAAAPVRNDNAPPQMARKNAGPKPAP